MPSQYEEQLKFENRFQQVLINLATRFINHPVDQMDQAITESLRQIVEFFGGLRATVYQVSEDRTHMILLYQWVAPDNPRVFEGTLPLSNSYSTTVSILEGGAVINVPNRDELPPNDPLVELLTDFGANAGVLVPIIRQGKLLGVISTSWREPREIRSEINDLLRVVGEIFLNAMDRRDKENRIRKLNEELEQRVKDRTTKLLDANRQLQDEIVERKQIEEALRTSEERYRIITEIITDDAYVCHVEPDGTLRIEWVNQDSYANLTGYQSGEVPQLYQAYHPEDRELARQDVERTLQGQATEREYRIIAKDGEIHWVYTRRYPVWDEQQQRVVQFYGVAQDITERKRAEEALRISEERYRLLTEIISDFAFLYRVEPDGTLRPDWVTEESYRRVTGFKLGETGHPFGMYHPEDQALAQRDVERTRRGQSTEGEYRIVTKDGRTRWLYLRRFPLWDEQHERVDRFYGVAQDITERKRAEEALRASEERYRMITELMSDYAFQYAVEPDETFKLEWVTGASFTRVTGYTVEEARRGSFRRYHVEDVDRARRDVELTVQGQPTAGEYRLYTKNGELHWQSMRRYPVWDTEQNRVVRFYGVAQDITERKRAEEALRISEERYRMVSELITDYAFLYHVESDGSLRLEWMTADPFARLTGYTVEEIGAAYGRYHPDDEALARQDVQLVLQGHSVEREYRIITKSSEIRWIYMRRDPLWDEQHEQVVRFYGVAQNITERKRIEAEEHEQRVLAEALLDTADALNSTLDLEDVFDRILANIERVAPHDAGIIMLIDSGVARVVRAKGDKISGWKEAIENLTYPLSMTPNLLQIYETGQPLIIPDVHEYPNWVDVPANDWIRSHFCIPLQQGNEVIGFLSCESGTPGFFTPKILSRLQAFAHQTASAITNARLYQQGQELAVLQERQRLARDLHDAVTQTMFSASMIAETMLRVLETEPEQVRKGLTQLRYLTRGAVAEMRSLLYELRPEELEGMNLTKLITQVAEAFGGKSGIIPTVFVSGDRALPQDVKIALYRIVQEALNNVSKHARASDASVRLSNDTVVELTISDNGRGFTAEQAKSGSLGLKIMRERAEKIGGRLTIQSEPGKGTTVRVEWVG